MRRQELFDSVISDLDRDLSDDAVFALAVAGTIQEQDSSEHCLLLAREEAASLVVEIVDQLDQIFEWQLCVADDELAIVLVEGNTDVEQLSRLLAGHHLLLPAKQSLDRVVFRKQVGVDRVHRDAVVVAAAWVHVIALRILATRSNFSDVVRLKNFIFIQRE